MNHEMLELPRLSLQERDRRYALVRRFMRETELDFLVIRGNSGRWDSSCANIRYLTQIGGNGEEGYVVFPLEGEPTCLIWFDLLVNWWRRAQDWVTDIRGGGHVVKNVVSVLKERGFIKGRCGIVGLGSPRDPDGIFSHTAYVKLTQELQGVRFQNATELMDRARLRKSPEEIRLIERAAAIGDSAIRTMFRRASPGVREQDVYAEMISTMLHEGAEYPVMLIWESGPAPTHPAWHVTQRVLQDGDLIVNELGPKYAGYWAHPHFPWPVGRPSRSVKEMFRICREAFQAGLEVIGPGQTLGEAERAITGVIQGAGYTWTHPVFHGMGLSQIEAPYSGFPGYEEQMGSDEFALRLEEQTFEEGMVVALQPIVATTEGVLAVPLADTLVVEEVGARRLSRLQFDHFDSS